LDTKQILEKALHDNTQGVVRFSLVASGCKLNEEEIDKTCQTIRTIKHTTHLEICVSGGLLTESNFKKPKEAGVAMSTITWKPPKEILQMCAQLTPIKIKYQRLRQRNGQVSAFVVAAP
jgi:phosphoribosylformimino-5-aminoimidazole carboxamide ribonucleotide (ProFAR) isomerase